MTILDTDFLSSLQLSTLPSPVLVSDRIFNFSFFALTFVVGIFYKETAGLSLEQIELLYIKDSGTLDDENVRAIMDEAKLEEQAVSHVEQLE